MKSTLEDNYHDRRCIKCKKKAPDEICYAFKYHFPLLAVCSDCKKGKNQSRNSKASTSSQNTVLSSIKNRIHLWSGSITLIEADAIIVPYYGDQPSPHEDAVHEIRNKSNIKPELEEALKKYDGVLQPYQVVETSGGRLGDSIRLYHLRMPTLFSNPDLEMIQHVVDAIISYSKEPSIISMPFLMPKNTTPHFMSEVAIFIIHSLTSHWKAFEERNLHVNLVVPSQTNHLDLDLAPLLQFIHNSQSHLNASVADSSSLTESQPCNQAQSQWRSSPPSHGHPSYPEKMQLHLIHHQRDESPQAKSIQRRHQTPPTRKLHSTPLENSLPASSKSDVSLHGATDHSPSSHPHLPPADLLDFSIHVQGTSPSATYVEDQFIKSTTLEPGPEPVHEMSTTRVETLIQTDSPTATSDELFASAPLTHSSLDFHGLDTLNYTDVSSTTSTTRTRTRTWQLGRSSVPSSTAHMQSIQTSDEEFASILASIDENASSIISDTPVQATFVELGLTSNEQLEAWKAENPEAFRD